jgi:hypothetical protein
MFTEKLLQFRMYANIARIDVVASSASWTNPSYGGPAGLAEP